MNPFRLRFAALALFVIASSATLHAVDYATVKHAGKTFITCTVDLETETLELFLKDDAGAGLKSFQAVEAWLKPRGRRLAFGMNGGMYHADYSPVGLHVEEGREISPLNLKPGDGNFFLKPNGVFAVTDAGAVVVEASRFPAVPGKVRVATQSGPMLVIAGKLHPAFREGSDNRLFRNGVGVSAAAPKRAVFAISAEPVNLHEFATLFRDKLRCENALFLDGTISSLHAPELKRSDVLIPLGPILGVTADAKTAPAAPAAPLKSR